MELGLLAEADGGLVLGADGVGVELHAGSVTGRGLKALLDGPAWRSAGRGSSRDMVLDCFFCVGVETGASGESAAILADYFLVLTTFRVKSVFFDRLAAC